MHVIFAINAHYQTLAFAKWFSNVMLARGIDNKVLLGHYTYLNGEEVDEYSFLISEEDFDRHREGFLAAYIYEQESFLYVTSCNKQYATLHFADPLKAPEACGCLKDVSAEEARKAPAYTYDPEYDRFFITVANSQSEAPAERDARELWAAIDAVLTTYGCGVSLNKLASARDKQKPKWLS